MANKLELTWYGKEKEINVEPRLLIEIPELSNTGAAPDTENMLIHGGNLLALKALEADFAGQIKCIYIDPPFNTGQAFEHYDDNVEHSIWLNLMHKRFKCLYNVLVSLKNTPILRLYIKTLFCANSTKHIKKILYYFQQIS